MGNALSTPISSAIETRPTLQPATPREVYNALEPMFLAYLTDAEKLGRKTVALYVDSVRDEPLWAVRAAIDHIRNGTAPDVNRNFLPKVPAFAEEVRRQSMTMRERQERQERIAKDEKRVREEFAADMEAKNDPTTRATRDRLAALTNRAARAM